jgi:HSP20 family protein
MNVTANVPVTPNKFEGRALGLFGSLQREIDQLFEDFTPGVRGAAADFRCKMDLAETKDGLELTVELPGLEEKDVDISVSDGALTIRGEKRFSTEEKDKNYRFIERGYGSFARTVELPAGIKAEDVKAVLDKGVLKVTIPTPAKPEPTKVPIRAS